MKTMLTCNYAVVRFLPYRETAEFVNVSIVQYGDENALLEFAKLEAN